MPRRYAFAANDADAGLEYALPEGLLARWRFIGDACWVGQARRSKVAPGISGKLVDRRRPGVSVVPSEIARPFLLGVVFVRLLASCSAVGYDDSEPPRSLRLGGTPDAWTYVTVCTLRGFCHRHGTAIKNLDRLPAYGFAFFFLVWTFLSIAAACYLAPARASVWSRAGNLCLFCYMWHRTLLPPLDAIVARVNKRTRADALLMLPLYLGFQILISQPFPRFGEMAGRWKRADVRFSDLAHPMPIAAAFFLVGIFSYAT